MKQKRILALLLTLLLAVSVFPGLTLYASGEPLIVILPGIMGSELQDSDGVIWPPVDFSTLTSIDISAISMADMSDLQNRTSIVDLIKKASANLKKLMFVDGKSQPGITAVQNNGTLNMYAPLAETLSQSYETVVFCYDWRQPNSASAEQLADFLKAYEGREIILVGHSMGGLVAAEYVKAHPGGDVSKVITLGTPYLGSDKANQTAGQLFAGGNENASKFINLLINSYVGDLLDSIPSMDELKPCESFDVPGGARWFAVYGTAAGNGDGTVTSESATNHFTIPNYAVDEWHTGLVSNWEAAGAVLSVIEAGALPNAVNSDAFPTSSEVYVDVGNGPELTVFEAYRIGGNNYFKLRDLAFVLGDKFNVTYENGRITLILDEEYEPVGGELQPGEAEVCNAVPSGDRVYLDSKPLNLTVYKIGDNNFFKLVDVAAAVGFGVEYDEATKAITILKNAL